MAAANCTCGGNETCENCIEAEIALRLKESGEAKNIERDWAELVKKYLMDSIDEGRDISIKDAEKELQGQIEKQAEDMAERIYYSHEY